MGNHSGDKKVAIHAYLANNPEATSAEIRKALAKKGISLSSPYTSTTRVAWMKLRKMNEADGTTQAPASVPSATNGRVRKKYTFKDKKAGKNLLEETAITVADLMIAKQCLGIMGSAERFNECIRMLNELRAD